MSNVLPQGYSPFTSLFPSDSSVAVNHPESYQSPTLSDFDQESVSSSSSEESQTIANIIATDLISDQYAFQQPDEPAKTLPEPIKFGKVSQAKITPSPLPFPSAPYQISDFKPIASIVNPKTIRNKSGSRCLAIARLLNLLICDAKPDWVCDSDWSQLPSCKNQVELVRIATQKIYRIDMMVVIVRVNDKVDQILQQACTLRSTPVGRKARFRWWNDTKGVAPELYIESDLLRDDSGDLERRIYLPPFLMSSAYINHLLVHDCCGKYIQEIQQFFQTIALKSLQIEAEIPRNHLLLVQAEKEKFFEKWAGQMEEIKMSNLQPSVCNASKSVANPSHC